jgi:hypothetical protein
MKYKDLIKPTAENFNHINSGEYIHDDITGCDYRMEYLPEDSTLLIEFQPSKGSLDWKQNFNFFPKKFEIYKDSEIYVHKGFASQYLFARNTVLDRAYQDDVKKIIVQGFSLGGALAQICVQDLLHHLPQKEIFGIAYEPPRPWIRNKKVKKQIKNNLLIVCAFWDPVVHVPFLLWGYRAYGKKIWIGKPWKIWPLQHYPDEVIKNLNARNRTE